MPDAACRRSARSSGRWRCRPRYLAWFVLPLLPWLRWGDAPRPRPVAGRPARGRGRLPRADPRALEAVDVPLAAARQRVPLPRGRRALRRAAEPRAWPRTHVRRRLVASAVADRRRRRTSPGRRSPSTLHRLADRHRAGRRAHRARAARLLGSARSARSPSPACSSSAPGSVVALQLNACSARTRARASGTCPSDVAALQSRFGDRTGTVMQFSDFSSCSSAASRWACSSGSGSTTCPAACTTSPASTRSTTTPAWGWSASSAASACRTTGFTQPCGYRSIWQSPVPGLPPLVDLMKVDTVVVEPRMAARRDRAAGWTRQAVRAPGAGLPARHSPRRGPAATSASCRPGRP